MVSYRCPYIATEVTKKILIYYENKNPLLTVIEKGINNRGKHYFFQKPSFIFNNYLLYVL